MKLKSTQVIVNDAGEIIMGNGRMQILASLNQTGSINKTAKEMKMSYKTAWSKIQTTQKNFGKPVVQADKKTGTRLTSDGHNLLEKFKLLKQRCIQADDTIFKTLFPG